eukprot:gene67-8373_t
MTDPAHAACAACGEGPTAAPSAPPTASPLCAFGGREDGFIDGAYTIGTARSSTAAGPPFDQSDAAHVAECQQLCCAEPACVAVSIGDGACYPKHTCDAWGGTDPSYGTWERTSLCT